MATRKSPRASLTHAKRVARPDGRKSSASRQTAAERPTSDPPPSKIADAKDGDGQPTAAIRLTKLSLAARRAELVDAYRQSLAEHRKKSRGRGKDRAAIAAEDAAAVERYREYLTDERLSAVFNVAITEQAVAREDARRAVVEMFAAMPPGWTLNRPPAVPTAADDELQRSADKWETRTIAEWVKLFGVSRTTFFVRRKRGEIRCQDAGGHKVRVHPDDVQKHRPPR